MGCNNDLLLSVKTRCVWYNLYVVYHACRVFLLYAVHEVSFTWLAT